jgi:hypothetical protein
MFWGGFCSESDELKFASELRICSHSARGSHRTSVPGGVGEGGGRLTLVEAELRVEGDAGGGGGHGGGNPRRKVLAGLRLRAWCRVLGGDGRRTGEGGDGSETRCVCREMDGRRPASLSFFFLRK